MTDRTRIILSMLGVVVLFVALAFVMLEDHRSRTPCDAARARLDVLHRERAVYDARRSDDVLDAEREFQAHCVFIVPEHER